ncbi:MAG: hypothetical protein J6U96_01675 [Elusimicrobiaceae bacterium]|nr:hypothetical protein [Elusimicrobiaceae bacterium]
MNPARIVFPGFWFGESSLMAAKKMAKRGVGGFCVYGGTAKETVRFIDAVRLASPYDHLLICADINEDLSEVVRDVPLLAKNIELGAAEDTEGAYRKGFLSARVARSIGIDWLLAPVVDIGSESPSFGQNPLAVARLCGDYAAGMANGGVLNCIKYFPGVGSTLKTLAQMEDTEFVPYKHMFRRADAVMPSDMVFSNLDAANRAVMSERIISGLLKKRLNYKGCVVSSPLFKSHISEEAAAALRMVHCGVELLLAPQDVQGVMDLVEEEYEKGNIADMVIRAVSNLELFTSKVQTSTAPVLPLKEALAQAKAFKK